MKLSTFCHQCHRKISLAISENSRKEVIEVYGNAISIPCNNCSKSEKYEIKHLQAEASPTAELIIISVLIGISPWTFIHLWNFLWAEAWTYVMLIILAILYVPIQVFSLLRFFRDNKQKKFEQR